MCVISSFHGSVDEFRRSRTVRSCSAGRTLAGIPAETERARVACCASARFVLSIAKQQRDPFSRGHWCCNFALVAVRRVMAAGRSDGHTLLSHAHTAQKTYIGRLSSMAL